MGLRLCGSADEPPRRGSTSLTSPTSVWASSTSRGPAWRRRRPPTRGRRRDRAIRVRSVCHGASRLGAARAPPPGRRTTAGPAGPEAASVPTGPPSWTARRSRRTAVQRARRPRRGRPASRRPSAPKVVGRACCSSVRPAIGVSRCVVGEPGRGVGRRVEVGEQRRRAPARRRASRAVSRTSWLVAPRWTSRGRRPADRRRQCARRAATTGLPLVGRRRRRAASDVERAPAGRPRDRLGAASGGDQPGPRLRPGRAPPRRRASPRSQTRSSTAGGDAAPRARTPSNRPPGRSAQTSKKTVSRSPCRRMSKR